MTARNALIQALDAYLRQDETAGDTDNNVYRRGQAAMSQALSSPEPAGTVAAYLMTSRSGATRWAFMPEDITPMYREVCAADGITIAPLYLDAPASALPTPAPTMVDEPIAWIDPLANEAVTASRRAAWPLHNQKRYTVAAYATRPTLQSLGGDAGVSEEQVKAAVDAWFDSGESDPHDFSGRMRAAIAALSLISTEKSDGLMDELFAAADEALELTRLHGGPQLPRLFEAVRAIQCSRSGG